MSEPLHKLELLLSSSEIELLEYVLSAYWDEGPSTAGWQSKELTKLSDYVAECIRRMDPENKDLY